MVQPSRDKLSNAAPSLIGSRRPTYLHTYMYIWQPENHFNHTKIQQSIQILDFNLKTMATCFDQINDKINKMEGIWNPIISKQAAGGKG